MESDEVASPAHFIIDTRYFLDQMIECVDGRPYAGDDAVVTAYLNFVQYGLKKERPHEPFHSSGHLQRMS